MGLLTFFYHNSAAVNKKIRGALGGNFLGAEVLFTVRIVLRKSGVTDSSIPYEISLVIRLRLAYDYPNDHSLFKNAQFFHYTCIIVESLEYP